MGAELELETKQLLYAEERIRLEALFGVDSGMSCVQGEAGGNLGQSLCFSVLWTEIINVMET